MGEASPTEVCAPVTLDEVVVQKVDSSGIGSVRGAKLKGMVLVGLEEFRGIHLHVCVCVFESRLDQE
jgi:hypothetical protein